jgi:hypothetical protein
MSFSLMGKSDWELLCMEVILMIQCVDVFLKDGIRDALIVNFIVKLFGPQCQVIWLNLILGVSAKDCFG